MFTYCHDIGVKDKALPIRGGVWRYLGILHQKHGAKTHVLTAMTSV